MSGRHLINAAQNDGAAIMAEFALTSFWATGLFVVACVCGYRYRAVWKAEGPRWQLWLFGTVAAVCLLVLGFVPIRA